MFFQVFTTLLIYSIILMLLTYYFNLFVSKTEYTREDFRNILPQLGQMFEKIYRNYSITGVLFVYLISGVSGIVFPYLFQNYLMNSALVPVILYFTGPRLAIYFEQTRVTISDNINDRFQIIYLRYHNYIITGFNAGFVSGIIYNWINLGVISFLWLVINLVIITFLTVMILRNEIFLNL